MVCPILLQQVSFVGLGISIMMFSIVGYFEGYIFHVLVAISIVFGFFEGCFITMEGPIAIKLCGPVGATQGIAFMYGLASVPQTMGAPIAGFIYDHTDSYVTSFLAAGVPTIMGALLMSLIYAVPGGFTVRHREDNPGKEDKESNGGSNSHELNTWTGKYVKTDVEDLPVFTIRIAERESELRTVI